MNELPGCCAWLTRWLKVKLGADLHEQESKMNTVNTARPLAAHLRAVSVESVSLTDRLRGIATERLTDARTAGQDVTEPAWGDALFGELWQQLNDVGMVENSRAYGVFSFAQAIENLTWELGRPDWACVHKGVHCYNIGLAFASIMEIDRAFKFFLLADEEDERNKGTSPGDLFRTKDIFDHLRSAFFTPWFNGTMAFYHHDGLVPDARLRLIAGLLAALPGRFVLARCHLGVFRACFLWHQDRSGMDSVFVEYLLAIEDLAVLTEAVSKMLHEGRSDYQNDRLTLGVMFRPESPVGALGYPVVGLDLDDEHAARASLAAAKGGDKTQTAAVVRRFRNLTAHPGPPPDWCLTPQVLSEVIEVQLDFVIAVAAACEAVGIALSAPPATGSAAAAPVSASSHGTPSATAVATFASGSSEPEK